MDYFLDTELIMSYEEIIKSVMTEVKKHLNNSRSRTVENGDEIRQNVIKDMIEQIMRIQSENGKEIFTVRSADHKKSKQTQDLEQLVNKLGTRLVALETILKIAHLEQANNCMEHATLSFLALTQLIKEPVAINSMALRLISNERINHNFLEFYEKPQNDSPLIINASEGLVGSPEKMPTDSVIYDYYINKNSEFFPECLFSNTFPHDIQAILIDFYNKDPSFAPFAPFALAAGEFFISHYNQLIQNAVKSYPWIELLKIKLAKEEYRQAIKFIKEENFDTAIEVLNGLLKVFTNEIELAKCYSTLASCYRDTNRVDEAISCCHQGLELLALSQNESQSFPLKENIDIKLNQLLSTKEERSSLIP